MPNDAKLGLLVGTAAVLVAAVLIGPKPSPDGAVANAPPAATVPAAPPAKAAVPAKPIQAAKAPAPREKPEAVTRGKPEVTATPVGRSSSPER